MHFCASSVSGMSVRMSYVCIHSNLFTCLYYTHWSRSFNVDRTYMYFDMRAWMLHKYTTCMCMQHKYTYHAYQEIWQGLSTLAVQLSQLVYICFLLLIPIFRFTAPCRAQPLFLYLFCRCWEICAYVCMYAQVYVINMIFAPSSNLCFTVSSTV